MTFTSQNFDSQFDFGRWRLGPRCLAAHILGENEPLKIPPATLGFYRHSLKPDVSGSAIAGSLPLPLE